jgi:hypothetical protein
MKLVLVDPTFFKTFFLTPSGTVPCFTGFLLAWLAFKVSKLSDTLVVPSWHQTPPVAYIKQNSII